MGVNKQTSNMPCVFLHMKKLFFKDHLTMSTIKYINMSLKLHMFRAVNHGRKREFQKFFMITLTSGWAVIIMPASKIRL